VITLRPLRDDEFDAWNAMHCAEYEHGLVEFAGMSRDAARAKVEHHTQRGSAQRLTVEPEVERGLGEARVAPFPLPHAEIAGTDSAADPRAVSARGACRQGLGLARCGIGRRHHDPRGARYVHRVAHHEPGGPGHDLTRGLPR